VQLLQLAAVKRAGEDQAADGITIASGTVGIHLATRITGGDIQGGEVADTRYLDVIGCLNELSSLD
jgi:hypothetical protein